MEECSLNEDDEIKLKEYVESVNPDLVHEDLPYHHSKFLDEFMLILIDGVDWS